MWTNVRQKKVCETCFTWKQTISSILPLSILWEKTNKGRMSIGKSRTKMIWLTRVKRLSKNINSMQTLCPLFWKISAKCRRRKLTGQLNENHGIIRTKKICTFPVSLQPPSSLIWILYFYSNVTYKICFRKIRIICFTSRLI